MSTLRTVPHVAIINISDGLVPDELLALTVEVYRSALPAFCKAWSIPLPGLAIYDSDHQGDPQEEAGIWIVNSANDPNAFGAHTRLGVAVFGYVDASLCLALREPVSRVLGHELFEMLVDPAVDRWADTPGGGRVALEVSDPVQRFSRQEVGEFFGATTTVEVADYVTPAWFQAGSPGPWDAMGVLPGPFAVADGGYVIRREAGAAAVTGSGRVTSFGRTFRRLAKRG